MVNTSKLHHNVIYGSPFPDRLRGVLSYALKRGMLLFKKEEFVCFSGTPMPKDSGVVTEACRDLSSRMPTVGHLFDNKNRRDFKLDQVQVRFTHVFKASTGTARHYCVTVSHCLDSPFCPIVPQNAENATAAAVSKMLNFVFKNQEWCIQTRNCVQKTRNLGFKTMNFAGPRRF